MKRFEELTARLGGIFELKSGKAASSGELREKISARAERLAHLGLAAGDRCLILHHNSIGFFIDWLAVWSLGACAVPCDGKAPESWLEDVERAVAPRLVVLGSDSVRTGKFSSELKWPVDAAVGLITSGSTRKSRIVIHDWTALRAKFEALERAIPREETERALCALPTFFGHGLICNSLFPLLRGGTLFIADAFSPQFLIELDETIRRHEIQFMSTTPSTWSLLESFARVAEKPSLRRVHCASSRLTARTWRQMQDWCGTCSYWNVYGMTEFLGWVAGHRIQGADDSGIVGPAAGWSCHLQLIDGEIAVSGPSHFVSQLNLDGESFERFPNDGLWRTRDGGEWTSAGELRVTGRLDFMINKGGMKIQPEEIEALLAEYSEVRNAACLGAPDEIWGEKIVLFVQPREQTGFSPTALKSWLSARVPAFKVPDVIQTMDAWPVTARGKVDRAALLAKFS